jgi:hypothetical protein
METRIKECSNCKELDYIDNMPTIDNKKYCNICADEFFDNQCEQSINEVLSNNA